MAGKNKQNEKTAGLDFLHKNQLRVNLLIWGIPKLYIPKKPGMS